MDWASTGVEQKLKLNPVEAGFVFSVAPKLNPDLDAAGCETWIPVDRCKDSSHILSVTCEIYLLTGSLLIC